MEARKAATSASMACSKSRRAPDRRRAVNGSSISSDWRRRTMLLSSFMGYRSLVEVLAGVKHLPRYATFLTSSSPSFRHSSARKDQTTMSKTRRNHGSAFKAKVALEALKGEQTVAEIASKHGLHPTLVTEWKRQLAEGASAVFEKGAGTAEKDGAALVGELYKQIGQQKVELDFLARKLGR